MRAARRAGGRGHRLERTAPEPATAARITADEPTQVVVELDAERDGLLLLHDNWYPGWNAYVDGEERKIHPANVTFRAVECRPATIRCASRTSR